MKLYVLSHQGDWEVRWEGQRSGRVYSLKTVAIRAARQEAARYPKGYCTQILVQKENGQWQVEWTYGRDPYPPEG